VGGEQKEEEKRNRSRGWWVVLGKLLVDEGSSWDEVRGSLHYCNCCWPVSAAVSLRLQYCVCPLATSQHTLWHKEHWDML